MIAVLAPDDKAFAKYMNYVRGRPSDYKRITRAEQCQGLSFERMVILLGAERSMSPNNFQHLTDAIEAQIVGRTAFR